MIEKLLSRLGLSVQKLYDDLDYWKMIGIASDIYEARTQRPEYIHYVLEAEAKGAFENEIIDYTLLKLSLELKMKWYKRPTFWRLLKCKIL